MEMYGNTLCVSFTELVGSGLISQPTYKKYIREGKLTLLQRGGNGREALIAYRSMTDGLVHLLRREAMSKGVSITYHDDNSISIELHIIVENGVNLPAVCRSIMNEVRYVVTRNTGVTVKDVDVCVDSMTL